MPTLSWLNKNEAITASKRSAYRLLKENPIYSYGDLDTDNLLIHGDNLEALKALMPFYAGNIKCIVIDPPYNTKNAFEHYDDNLEHSKWLSLIYPRLELLHDLLNEAGTLWVTIGDDQNHYLKVILDEIFGRENFLNQISAKMKQTSGASGGGEDKKLKKNIEYVLVYAKDIKSFTQFRPHYEYENLFDYITRMRRQGKSWKYTRAIIDFGYSRHLNTIKDGSGKSIEIYEHKQVKVMSVTTLARDYGLSEEEAYIKFFDLIFRDTNAQSSIRSRVQEATKNSEADFFSIKYVPRSGRYKGQEITLYYKGRNRDLIAWLSDIAVKENGSVLRKEKLGTLWEGFPLNNLTKEGGVRFPGGKKPEELIRRIIELASDTGDLVLDSFLGSGTTAAVAQKLNRRFIGVEIGEHAKTHCLPRLKKVVDGEQGGISNALNWQGGGGFRFCELGETVFDQYGCLNSEINFQTLASHVWYLETHTTLNQVKQSPFLGIHNNIAYYLLYNGILGDRRVNGGNVLTSRVLSCLPNIHEFLNDDVRKIVIYGESSRLGESRLKRANITFKQIPYDVSAI